MSAARRPARSAAVGSTPSLVVGGTALKFGLEARAPRVEAELHGEGESKAQARWAVDGGRRV